MAASEKAREMEEAAKAEDLDRVRRTMSSLFDILDKTTGEKEREVM
jgi:hypothetical protein